MAGRSAALLEAELVASRRRAVGRVLEQSSQVHQLAEVLGQNADHPDTPPPNSTASLPERISPTWIESLCTSKPTQLRSDLGILDMERSAPFGQHYQPAESFASACGSYHRLAGWLIHDELAGAGRSILTNGGGSRVRPIRV